MPLYVQNGNLIQKAGTLGISSSCCCSSGCNCPSGPIQIPTSVTVVFSLGDFISSFNGTCTHDDAVALIEGTYVLSPTVIQSDFVLYTLTTENGAQVSFKWLCTPDLNGRTAEFSYSFCNQSAECFARVFDGIMFFYSTQFLDLCTYPQNNTDTNTFDSNPNFVFLEQGPLLFGCSQTKSLTGRRYYFSLDITASW